MSFASTVFISLISLVLALASSARPLGAQTSRSDSAAILGAARQFSAAYMRGDAGS
jgi:hypothetical protein